MKGDALVFVRPNLYSKEKSRYEKEVFLSMAICLTIFASLSFAGVWEDNFNDGKADGWSEVAGDWKVDDGAYHQTVTEAVYQKSVYKDMELSDFTVEVDVNIAEMSAASTSVAAGLLLRTDDEGSAGYRFWIRADSNGFQFSIWQNNAFSNLMNDPNQVAESGTYYHLKVQMEGYVFSAWLDDELMVDEYEDTSKLFESGLVGFINYNADCYYDNLTISGDRLPQIWPSLRWKSSQPNGAISRLSNY